jgi:hypothetical protein
MKPDKSIRKNTVTNVKVEADDVHIGDQQNR